MAEIKVNGEDTVYDWKDGQSFFKPFTRRRNTPPEFMGISVFYLKGAGCKFEAFSEYGGKGTKICTKDAVLFPYPLFGGIKGSFYIDTHEDYRTLDRD